LILQSAVFSGGAVFGSARRRFRLPGKFKTRKSRLFSAFHGHLADLPLPAAGFRGAIACVCPIRTGKAAIPGAIAANSRRVR
jgi:hypothetical protein